MPMARSCDCRYPARMKSASPILVALLLAGCATADRAVAPADIFFDRLSALCGKAYEGRIASPPAAADSSFAGKRLVMHVRECSDERIRVPFHVGGDRSRTWVISRTGTGLRLKHDHRHEDGSEDRLTNMAATAIPPEPPAASNSRPMLFPGLCSSARAAPSP